MIDLKAMRSKAVPIVGIESQDNAAAIKAAMVSLNGGASEYTVLQWDIAQGWSGWNDMGARFCSQNENLSRMTVGESLAMMAKELPGGSILFLHNAQRVLDRDGVAQGIWLCRDAFKSKKPAATLVLLGPSLALPQEINSDVVMITEKAPEAKEISEIITKLYTGAAKAASQKGINMPEMTPDTGRQATDAALGLLSRFDVEQTVSLALNKEGLDIADIWRRKIARIKLQSGAEIWTDCPTFDALAGCQNIKGFLRAYIGGRRPPGCVLFLDEIEKMLAGAGTDSSGVTGKMLGQFLTWTQDRQVDGILLLGVPGAGKSATAKCTAGAAKVPCFRLNMAEAQGSLVGQSEANLKAALASVDSISGGRVLMIGTCNSVGALAPELMGRFRLGTFFYDYPSAEENAALWDMYPEKVRAALGGCPASQRKLGWPGD